MGGLTIHRQTIDVPIPSYMAHTEAPFDVLYRVKIEERAPLGIERTVIGHERHIEIIDHIKPEFVGRVDPSVIVPELVHILLAEAWTTISTTRSPIMNVHAAGEWREAFAEYTRARYAIWCDQPVARIETDWDTLNRYIHPF